MGQRDPDHEKVGIYFLLFPFLSGFYLNVSHLYVTLLSVTKHETPVRDNEDRSDDFARINFIPLDQ